NILHVHLADAPRKVRRLLPDDRAGLLILLVEGIDVIDEDAHPRAGLSLPALAKEDFDFIPGNAAEGLVLALAGPVPFLFEAELGDVVVDARGNVLHGEDGRKKPEFRHGHFSFIFNGGLKLLNDTLLAIL